MEQKDKGQKVSPRHLARVFALLGVYQWFADPTRDYASIEAHLSSLLQDDDGEVVEGTNVLLRDFVLADKAFFAQILEGSLNRQAEIQKIVAEAVDRDWNHVSMVERCVLVLGTFELLACPETPYRVILNEYIELAKEFGSGHRYTNAVLNTIAAKLRDVEVKALQTR